ncbi:MAG: hypothetical protein A2868_02310 [Candidatus Levybacteria bacterium RIFCSPHIGHO2_01_FULL_40_15b]|nr:MAG: hypothetical protein A2868_02310 [Candidatus Levybacteria bacterium RIFCSPHIGHO2_01_FULL_40_15b]
MRRYKSLTKEDIFEALNEVRDAFLAAKDGKEVDEIMSFMLTTEEKIKLGRRVLLAKYLELDMTLFEIRKMLKIGKSTIQFVTRRAHLHPLGLELIRKRGRKVEDEYQRRKFREVGGSQLVFKRKEYTGFRRKDVKR